LASTHSYEETREEIRQEQEYEERIRVLHPLVEFINDAFTKARDAKRPIEERMLECLRAFKMQYSEEKLAAIREIGGSEVYLPLTNVKARALKAWLNDVFFRPGEPPFDIEPSPVPTPTEATEEKIGQGLQEDYSEIMQKVAELQMLSGGQIDVSAILEKMEGISFTDEYMRRVEERVKELAEQEKKRIDDQFTEGGFYEALDHALLDIAIFPCAIIKGSVPRKKKIFDKKKQVVEKVIPTFNRVSPFDIYPSPTATDFSDYVIEILHLTPADLASLRGVDGYNDQAIKNILERYGDDGYEIPDTMGTSRWDLEGKKRTDAPLIDVIEFWGEVPGRILDDVELVTLDRTEVEIEPDEYYSVQVLIVDDEILKCVLNPDPFGEKPYAKASFVTIPDSFWGQSLAEVLLDLQEAINALARATINNAVLSSGPMVERNIDRIPQSEEKAILPWKIFDATTLGFNEAPAYRFYQPRLTSAALVQVIAYFLKLADELSGVPAYAHSDVTSGAAARTAAGLQMLMQSSSKGLKQVVKAIDEGIIAPIVRRQYYMNVIDFYGVGEEVPDLNIRPKGTEYLLEREAQTQRLLELLNLTNNPTDLQLLGQEGRKMLLERIFKNFGVEIPFDTQMKEMVDELTAQLSRMQAAQTPKPAQNIETVPGMAGQMRAESLQMSGFKK